MSAILVLIGIALLMASGLPALLEGRRQKAEGRKAPLHQDLGKSGALLLSAFRFLPSAYCLLNTSSMASCKTPFDATIESFPRKSSSPE